MVTFVPGFLTETCRQWLVALIAEEEQISLRHPADSPEWYAEQRAFLDANPPPPCGIPDVADHVEHVRDVAGVDHVGLGGDLDGTLVTPMGSVASTATRPCCPSWPTAAGPTTTWPS